MDWTDRFLAGVELRDPTEFGATPLDFVVWSDSQSLCLVAGWWRANWGQGKGGLIVMSAPFDEETGRFDGLSTPFAVAGPSDGTQLKLLQRERLQTDLDRAKYLAQLQLLREYEPSFDFDAWTEAVLKRKPAPLIVGETGQREVGTIRFLDAQGKHVDTLLIDEHGQIATVLADGWLALFAEQWAEYADEDRPGVGEYLEWMQAQRPYDAGGLTDASVFSDEGPPHEILTRALTPLANKD